MLQVDLTPLVALKLDMDKESHTYYGALLRV